MLAHVVKASSFLNPDANILAAEADKKEKQINAVALIICKICALFWKILKPSFSIATPTHINAHSQDFLAKAM